MAFTRLRENQTGKAQSMTLIEKTCWFLTGSIIVIALSWATVPTYEPQDQPGVTRAGW